MTQAIRPEFVNCARCGEAKKVGRSGPLPTYCSGSCRAAVKYERSREDGQYEQELAAARQRTAERQARDARPCPYCATPMTHPRRVQCGAERCRLQYAADRMRQWQRDHKAATGEWYHRNYAEQQREYSRRRYQERPHWRVLNPERGALIDARRRMRIQQARASEIFAPIEVHVRDNWTCQICQSLIDSGIAWPDPMSPSLDHVIPLSKGGAHSMANVQSAHLGCNSSKGDKVTVLDALMALAMQALYG